MTINNATVEQINVALLDIDKRIKALNADSETLKSLQNSVKTIKSSLNGITTGMAKALTVNGKTYNGSEAVDAGVQLVENGGTSSTNAEEGFNTLADGVRDSSTPTDDEKILLKSSTWYKTTCLDFWEYIKGKISSVLGLTKDNYGGKANTAGKAVEVVDYGNTSRTVKIGYSGPSTTAKNLLYLAGYIESDNSSVKLKDVGREELLKWLGIAVAIKYADYRTEELSFSSSTDQKKINLSDFGPGITEENVINFMVIYWTGVPIIASGDWAKSQGLGTAGLGCALHTLNANGGTGRCVVRCVYTTSIIN